MDQFAHSFLSFLESFKEPYNRFVKHYNDADNKISAVADLATNREVIEQDINNIHSKIDYWVEQLCEHLLFEKIQSVKQNEAKIELNSILNRLKKFIDYRNLANNPDELLEQLAKSIREFYECSVSDPIPHILPKSIPLSMVKKMVDSPLGPGGLDGALSGINTISTLGKEVRRKQAMLSAVDDVLNTIIDKCYPDNNELELWENLSIEQQYKAANEFARNLLRKKKKNLPVRDKIIDTVASIIHTDDKELDDYLTSSGRAKSKLYRHPKIQKFDNGNARRWIDVAIETGELKKKLNTG